MSAYSEWKCGAISYEEMRDAMAYEARRDEYYESLRYADEKGEDDGEPYGD